MTDQAEKKHSAFWGVMVIAGTVIGGGMFALPVDLAGAWFFWGAFILIIAWFSMLHSGLLLLEANLNYPIEQPVSPSYSDFSFLPTSL